MRKNKGLNHSLSMWLRSHSCLSVPVDLELTVDAELEKFYWNLKVPYRVMRNCSFGNTFGRYF